MGYHNKDLSTLVMIIIGEMVNLRDSITGLIKK